MRKIAFMILILASCQKDDVQKQPESDYIVFGHFYGECLGEKCVEIFKLTDDQLYEDSNDKYPDSDKIYDGNFRLLDNVLFEKVKALKGKVPQDLLNTDQKIIGSPDAGDWGGIYFEISINGKKDFWLIDKKETNLPENLRPFVNEVEDNIEWIAN